MKTLEVNERAAPLRDRTMLFILVAALPALSLKADTPTFGSPSVVGTNQSAWLPETSGLVASRQNPHVLWAHNDSGDGPRLYAISPSGALLGIYTLSGASAWDWEDIAISIDPDTGIHYLLAGDIGDNNAVRETIRVYRVAEPIVSTNQLTVTNTLSPVTAFTLMYPDGARDAETLLADPLTGDWFILSKREDQSRIYRVAYPQNAAASTTMEYLGQLQVGWTTGGDVSPSGRQILIKRYPATHYYSRGPTQTVAQALTGTPVNVPVATEPQGEAVGWQGQEKGYYTLSEGPSQPIYYFESLDGDSDGLLDSEEVAYGSDMGVRDSDGDGQADGDEVVAGESPTNAASVFRITEYSVSDGAMTLGWYGRASRTYGVQCCIGHLGGSAHFTPALSNIVIQADGPVTTNLTVSGDPVFFRLDVVHDDGW